MITKMTVTNIHVIDQDSAYDFYVNKLGFRVVDDIPMGPDTRWLTVSPPEQPDLQIVLFPVVVSKMFPQKRSEEHTSELQSLMRISYAVFCLKKKKNIT